MSLLKKRMLLMDNQLEESQIDTQKRSGASQLLRCTNYLTLQNSE